MILIVRIKFASHRKQCVVLASCHAWSCKRRMVQRVANIHVHRAPWTSDSEVVVVMVVVVLPRIRKASSVFSSTRKFFLVFLLVSLVSREIPTTGVSAGLCCRVLRHFFSSILNRTKKNKKQQQTIKIPRTNNNKFLFPFQLSIRNIKIIIIVGKRHYYRY